MNRPHILIIDDTEVIRDLLQHILAIQPENYLVSHACDGVEGIEQIRKLRPDVIILDVHMPKKNGHEVAQYLRSIGDMTPIIMISSNPEDNKLKGYASGCNVFLAKPFDLRTLCFHVRAQLHAARQHLIQQPKAS